MYKPDDEPANYYINYVMAIHLTIFSNLDHDEEKVNYSLKNMLLMKP
jgi:hypothetical protein